MKQLVMPLLAMVLSVSAVKAQTAKDVFDRSVKITYLGVDFTKTKVIGDAGLKTDDVVDHKIRSLNQKLVNEPKKFPLAEAFGKREEVSTDIGPVNKRNDKIDPDKLLSDNSDDYQTMKPEDVTSLVSGFDFAGKTGIGLLFVMEGINKTKREVSVYVTLIDMKSKKVLFTDRVEGAFNKSAFGFTGFTVDNVWLGGLANVIKEIKDKKYKDWKSTYGG
ncbi:hypothetical protein GFS24_13055 [Chitinophaga sp. SYP-B3965]|uniref:hypothetical protein n=1 Tax=Chitinophaga sp. SYP-B3965 TaxID=2663120 RepID=UPI001299A9CF|nr:hypothetical protein [Chitinophaga sp. SYP-B3965]MRG46050.1 hypothetical protein [Chitinophaga sp. SYP-B3965]